MRTRTQLKKYRMTADRLAEFERLPDEDTYQWITRQLDMATPFEAAWLMMLREDEKQHRAFQMLQLAKTERSNRHMKMAMFVTVAISALNLIFK